MKRIVALITVAFMAFTIAAMPASAAPNGGTSKTVNLIAGQNMDVGSVELKIEDGKLFIRFTTEGGWCLRGIHVDANAKCCDIPQKNGNPIPGKFDLKMWFGATNDTGWIEVPYCGCPKNICVAAHAEVFNCCACREETAWGEGCGFPGKNWAMFILFQPYLPE